MTQLLEMKDKIIRIYSKYDTYFTMAIKFVLGLVLFTQINSTLGYMSKVSNLTAALVLSLFCSIIPINGMILLAGLVILLDLYALALEAAIIGAVLFIIIYLIYFRFSPKFGYGAVLTPLCFRFHIPYIMPMATGLLHPIEAVVSVVCGTVLYYFLDGIRLNSSILTASTLEEGAEASSKLNIILGQLLNNDEMFLMIVIFVMTSVVVYFTRRMAVEHAWTIAIVAGELVQVAGLLVGYQLFNISGKELSMILGNCGALLISFVLQFIFMNLDYVRTERVQFEDDEYYYYVVAIPKKMVASKEKKVQHFGNTSSMGKRIDYTKSNTSEEEESVSRKVLAEELDIDENLLK